MGSPPCLKESRMSITLTNVGSGFKRTAINSNFEAIEAEINANLLTKNGGIGLEADLDANSNRVINLTDGVLNQDAATVGQLNVAASSIGTGTITKQTEVQLGSAAVANVFTLALTATAAGLEVGRNGVEQELTTDYTFTPPSTVTLTFTPNDNDRFKFKVYTAA